MSDAADKGWRACVPAALTLGNAFAGLGVVWLVVAAVHRPDASIADLRPAASMVFLAWVFDVLDGPAARRFGVAGPFGAVLDSLADVVSFGVGPPTLASAAAWIAGDATVKAATAAAALLYLAGATVRLARFTARALDKKAGGDRASPPSDLPFFRGLPSPAAGMMAATGGLLLADLGQQAGGFALAGLMALLAAAMVSALPYVDLPKAWVRRALPRWPLAAPVAAALAFGLAVGLLVLFVPYLASGPLMALRQRRVAGQGS